MSTFTDPMSGAKFDVRSRRIAVRGLDRIARMLNVNVLAQPEFDDALATFRQRIERKSKGLGAQVNTLMSETQPLSVRTESTLVWPRTVGTAWTLKLHAAIGAMAPRVINKAIQRIEARWGGWEA